MKRSMRRASFGDMYGATSKFFTSPAIWLARRDGSKRVMRVMPPLPARAAAHACATLLPMGLTMPRPVRTTLRRLTSREAASGLGVRLDVIDGLLHGGDLLCLLVGNLGLELLFQRHDELHRIKRIGAQIIDERGIVLDLRLVHAELLGDDLLDRLLDALRHRLSPSQKGGVFYAMYMPPLTCSTQPVT